MKELMIYDKFEEEHIFKNIHRLDDTVINAFNAFQAKAFLEYIKESGLTDEDKYTLLKRLPDVMKGDLEIVGWEEQKPKFRDNT